MRIKDLPGDDITHLAQHVKAAGTEIDELPAKIRDKVRSEIKKLKERENAKGQNAGTAIQAKPEVRATVTRKKGTTKRKR